MRGPPRHPSWTDDCSDVKLIFSNCQRFNTLFRLCWHRQFFPIIGKSEKSGTRPHKEDIINGERVVNAEIRIPCLRYDMGSQDMPYGFPLLPSILRTKHLRSENEVHRYINTLRAAFLRCICDNQSDGTSFGAVTEDLPCSAIIN